MTGINKSKAPKVVLVLSVMTSIFWCLGQLVDVYYFAVTGAIFEIMWLPMIALIFALPILSLVFLAKEKFSLKSLHLYSFLILLATILLIVSRN
jgi:hypothetical protein